MDKEEAYFKDILPEIGQYALNQEERFSSGDIAEDLARYNSKEVEDLLDYISHQEEIHHLEKAENGDWVFTAFQAETWEGVDRELEQDDLEAETEIPDIRSRIKSLSAQEYGKLRNNLEEVYDALKDVKDERKSYFSTKDLKDRVRNVRPAEIGVVLSGLATAGLLKKYRDRNDYEPESIDTENIEAFKDVVERTESFEEFKEMITEEE
jgi:hypothetical protein